MVLGVFGLVCFIVSVVSWWRASDPVTIGQLKMSMLSSGVVTLVAFAVELSGHIKGV
ncbi:hypothetical protein D3C71_1424840 [compost metagenome]